MKMESNPLKGLSSDRAMAMAMAACYKLAANTFPAYNKETADKITETGKKLIDDYLKVDHLYRKGIDKIYYPELMDELSTFSKNYLDKLLTFSRNYKPTKQNMKQFKNKFAVSGDIIQLLTFEKELIKLGYILGSGSLGKSDVFNYRGISKNPATFITVGFHNPNGITPTPGTYIPASNDGNAKQYNLLYDLSFQFQEALKVASEVIPATRVIIIVTEDGVDKYIDDTAWCVKGSVAKFIKNGLDEKTPWPGCKYFHTSTAALKYINSITPLLTTEDGVKKFLGDQVWYIRQDWTYHLWKSGLNHPYSEKLKYFDKEENLIAYIKENRPVITFSKAKLEKFVLDMTGIKTVIDVEYPKDFVKRD